MRLTQRDISCQYLDELIELLDEERETRACLWRPELAFAMSVLREEARWGGASDRTVDLIYAAELVLALHDFPTASCALH